MFKGKDFEHFLFDNEEVLKFLHSVYASEYFKTPRTDEEILEVAEAVTSWPHELIWPFWTLWEISDEDTDATWAAKNENLLKILGHHLTNGWWHECWRKSLKAGGKNSKRKFERHCDIVRGIKPPFMIKVLWHFADLKKHLKDYIETLENLHFNFWSDGQKRGHDLWMQYSCYNDCGDEEEVGEICEIVGIPDFVEFPIHIPYPEFCEQEVADYLTDLTGLRVSSWYVFDEEETRQCRQLFDSIVEKK